MKKNRSTLKDYFKKGAIPTEANFADLIDSMLNQDEDNISKLPNDPLKITATGVDEALLNFYRVEKNEEKLSWQVKQKPDGKPGLSISDTAASRFFIENGSGNVGIGTTTPKQTLDVRGRMNIENGVIQRGGEAITNTSDLGLYSRVEQQWIRIVSSNAPIRFFTDGGIGTKVSLSVEADKVEVNSNLQLAGNNDFITRIGMLCMGTTDKSNTSAGKVLGAIGFWGFGVQHGQLSFRAGKGFELVDRSSNEPNLNYDYDSHPYADLKINNLLTTGSVGIGTVTPGAKLQVSAGNIQLDGNQKIFFSDTDTTNNLKLQLWSGYGLGINGSTLFYAANGQHSWRDNAGANERMLLTTGADGGLTVKGTGVSSFVGNVGIGTTSIHNPQGWNKVLDILGTSHARLNVRSSGGVVTSIFSHDSWGGARGVIGTDSNHPLTFVTNYAHRMTLDTSGDIWLQGKIGTNGYSPTPRTSGWGGGIHTWDIEAEGTIWSRSGYQSGNRDLAEEYQSDMDNIAPGDVVCLDAVKDRIILSEKPNDSMILGVVSTAPGFLLNIPRETDGIHLFPVALCGRVPCKVVDENGPIKRGDLLTSSSTPGHAMKSSPVKIGKEEFFRPGTVIGKALGALESGSGEIEIFVFSS